MTSKEILKCLADWFKNEPCIDPYHCIFTEECKEDFREGGCIAHDAYGVVNELMACLEDEYPVCMACGQRIDQVKVLMFDHEGADHWYMAPIYYDKPTGGVSIKTTRAWTSFDDYSESYTESIRCPLCDKHPFDKEAGCEIYQPVEVVMWTKGKENADERNVQEGAD